MRPWQAAARARKASWTDLEQRFFENAPPEVPEPALAPMSFADLEPTGSEARPQRLRVRRAVRAAALELGEDLPPPTASRRLVEAVRRSGPAMRAGVIRARQSAIVGWRLARPALATARERASHLAARRRRAVFGWASPRPTGPADDCRRGLRPRRPGRPLRGRARLARGGEGARFWPDRRPPRFKLPPRQRRPRRCRAICPGFPDGLRLSAARRPAHRKVRPARWRCSGSCPACRRTS